MGRMNLPNIPKNWDRIRYEDEIMDNGMMKISISGKKGFLEQLPKQGIFQIHKTLHRLNIGTNKAEGFPIEKISVFKGGQFVKIEIRYPNAICLGLGDKTGKVNRRGEYHFWNLDDANHGVDSDPLYQSHPIAYLMAEKIALIIVDSPAYQYWKVTEIGIEVIVKDKNAVVYAGEFSSLADAYFGTIQCLGTFSLPPIWAIGYQQSRWSYEDEEKIRFLSEKFKELEIPCDVFYLDIAYMEGYRCFTVDKNRFPNLRKLSQEIPQKLVAIIDPGLKKDENYGVYREGLERNVFLKNRKGKVHFDRVWPGKCAFPDFLDEDVRKWWGKQYSVLLEQGIEGFWNDMNEPSTFSLRRTFPKDLNHFGGERHEDVHNLYGLMMAKGTHEGMVQLRPENRSFILSRSSYLGGQNFAWMWTGDNKSTWEFLQLSVRQMQSISVSGQPLCGADVGGFLGDPEPELILRWTQLGVFYPLFRNHTAYGTQDQEPWNFPEVFPHIREAIRLRYKLLPYIYTQMFFSSLGMGPLIRPMTWLEKHVDDEVLNRQFLFGENLLVSPVLEPTDSIRVELPSGEWYDFFTGEAFQGTIEINVDLATIPIFVKSGSSIPLAKKVGITAKETLNSGIEIRNFGANPKGYLYLDDGSSLSYRKGEFKLFQLPEMEEVD